MREIKFRAWDTSKKQMFNVICLDFKEHGYIDEEIGWHKDFICHLMQYTGLKDKNGKEIYEGDIVKGWIYDEYDEEKDKYDKVFWHDEYCGFYIDYIEEYRLYELRDAEIIGNIYENPELIP